MAVFNEINEFGLASILVRRLGMQVGTPTPAVAPEIFPTMALESDRPEWGFLKGEKFAGRNTQRAAIAGQYGAVQLYVPSTTNVIAVVTAIISHDATSKLIARAVGIGGGIAGWGGVTTAARDFRYPGNGTSAILEGINNAAQPSNFSPFARLTTAGERFEQPIIITPGTSLVVFNEAVNQSLTVTITWRERTAQPGELA